MALPVNTTALTGIENWTGIFTWVNLESGGMFSIMLLLSVFIISYVYMSAYRPETAFLGSSMSVLLLAFVFWALGFLSPQVIVGLTVLIVGTVAVSRYRD